MIQRGAPTKSLGVRPLAIPPAWVSRIGSGL